MPKTKKTRKRINKRLHFKDYPDFLPNLTPREMFKLGSFGVLIGALFIQK